jgi:hypothetical protein
MFVSREIKNVASNKKFVAIHSDIEEEESNNDNDKIRLTIISIDVNPIESPW